MVWDRPQDFVDLLPRRFPDVDFSYAASIQSVRQVLGATNPEVVFSIKVDRFPVACHLLAVAHPGVKWVQVGGSGYEHLVPVDLSGVALTNSAGVLAPYVAETVTAAMLSWNGHLSRYRDQQQARVWRRIPFTSLSDQSLLVVGVGAIGACVAANAKSLGMRVLGAKRRADPMAQIDRMYSLDALDEALPQADYVSIHLRLNHDTRHFVDHRRIAAMKTGAFLINTARGPVVDTVALIAGLGSGQLSGAYLDVFDEEPLPEAHPLWAMENVLITPHAADSIVDWPRRFAGFFADNLQRWLRGEPLENEVQVVGRQADPVHAPLS